LQICLGSSRRTFSKDLSGMVLDNCNLIKGELTQENTPLGKQNKAQEHEFTREEHFCGN
jgi:hypothetical protein